MCGGGGEARGKRQEGEEGKVKGLKERRGEKLPGYKKEEAGVQGRAERGWNSNKG